MTIKERSILLKIHENVLKLTQPPATTFAPQTGQLPPKVEYVPPVVPLPLPPAPKFNG